MSLGPSPLCAPAEAFPTSLPLDAFPPGPERARFKDASEALSSIIGQKPRLKYGRKKKN